MAGLANSRPSGRGRQAEATLMSELEARIIASTGAAEPAAADGETWPAEERSMPIVKAAADDGCAVPRLRAPP